MNNKYGVRKNGMTPKTKIVSLIALIFTLITLGFIGTVFFKSYSYGMDIGGHLKRTANANTVELAKKEIETALNNIKYRNLTEGNTGILFRTPSKDGVTGMRISMLRMKN